MEKIKAILSSRSKFDEITGCIVWTGFTNASGYGRFQTGTTKSGTSKQYFSHRASYEVNIGHIPDGIFVCHKCDNRKCINPDHLFLGTARDNNNDMVQKNRSRHARGQLHGLSKLTENQVFEIFNMKGTYPEIGSKFSITQETVYNIKCGRSWGWLTKNTSADYNQRGKA